MILHLLKGFVQRNLPCLSALLPEPENRTALYLRFRPIRRSSGDGHETLAPHKGNRTHSAAWTEHDSAHLLVPGLRVTQRAAAVRARHYALRVPGPVGGGDGIEVLFCHTRRREVPRKCPV